MTTESCKNGVPTGIVVDSAELFCAVCYSDACTYLDRRPPRLSLVALSPVLSIVCTLVVNLTAQLAIFFWLTQQPWSVSAFVSGL